jgi:hypothetical protein
MSANRKIGLELHNGHDIGRDPRRMTGDELTALGHQRMGPLKALRLRCVDCSGGLANEVRLCTAVQCPAWPFRMGKNPWRGPVSEARRKQASSLSGRRARLADEQRTVGHGGAPQDVPATPIAAATRAGETPFSTTKKSEDRA